MQKNIQEKAEDKILKVAIIGSEYAPELSSAFSNIAGMSIFEDISIDSIGNFINDEISKGSLVTQVSSKDNRVKIIQPSSELIDEFTMWLDMIDKAA